MNLYTQVDFDKLCKDTEQKKKHIKKEENEINRVLNLCNKAKYKHGKVTLTLSQLIDLIQVEEKADVATFLELFPPTGLKDVNITRSHVFEALWIIIFILKLDDLIDISKEKRILYKSLERGGIAVDYVNHLASFFLEQNNVNASRSGGIVDIYFEQFNKNDTPEIKDEKFACEGGCDMDASPATKRKKFLYSSKFYLKEKGVGNYDIDKIFTEAIHKINDNVENFKIGVLVNNKSDLFDKCRKSAKVAANILNREISYDTTDLNIYYKRLLVFLKKHNKNVDTIVERTLELEPRFHQQYFINYTNEQINKHKFKYIWGAVPRSGKSYMIGGLIATRQPQNVLIILGAVSETNKQFYKMFETFTGSYSSYNIVNISDEKDTLDKYAKIEPAKKNIVIISQQQLWQRHKTTGAQKIVDKLKQLLAVKDKMVFFDEIHQGAGEDSNAQVTFLNEYIFGESDLNFPFIMVTATFSKPILKYKTFGNAEPLLVQWTYDMIQSMKDIANPETLEYMQKELLDELDGDLKNKHFTALVEKYVETGRSLYDLQYEYELYPELCVICPDLTANNSELSDIRDGVHTDLNISDIFDLNKLKKGTTIPVQKLLNYIEHTVYEDCLLNINGFDVLNKQHTQLWFLPTHLVTEKKNSKTKDSEEDTGMIEPLMRYLMLELLKNPFFRDNFCFLILHGTNITKLDEKKYADIKKLYKDTISDVHKLEIPTNKKSFEKLPDKLCFTTKCLRGGDDKECIRQEECSAYKLGKSLIILTGQKMRVGVSLPCVDIALHMDPITSVDVIYQSMFRVLTERNGKKKAYFVDILKSRFINFLYEYESNVSFGKKPASLTERFNKAHQLLYSFNLNGINLQDNTKDYLNIYKRLVDELGLNNEYSFNQKTKELKQNEDNSKSVINLLDDTVIDELYKIIQRQTYDKIKQSVKAKLLTRTGIYQPTTRRDDLPTDDLPTDADDLATDDLATDDLELVLALEDTATQERKRKEIQEYTLNLLTLYILFNDNDDNKCTNMKEIETGFNNLDKELPYISSDYEAITDFIKDVCDNEMGNMIDCYYLKSLNVDTDSSNMPIEELIKGIIVMLQNNRRVFKIIIDNIRHNEISKNEFFKLYCNIKDSILMVKTYSNQNKANIVAYDETELDKSVPDCSATFIVNEKILKVIREHLTIRKDEKEKNGEVFTPPELICEMLDRLPKSIWKDPLLKWLDPANGIGNFPIIAYYKLMESLKDIAGYADEDVRSKHIIEEMLFMVELNKVNVEVSKKVFKMIDSNAVPNIVCADFIKEESIWKPIFAEKKGVNAFDVIIGNPPFNSGGIRSKNEKTKEGTETIWPDFVKSSIALLKNDTSYLLIIHPSSWISLQDKTRTEMLLSKQLLYLRFYNVVKAHALFGNTSGEIPLAYYLLQNINTQNDTEIYDNAINKPVKFNIYENKYIPTESIRLMKTLLVLRNTYGSLQSKYYNSKRPNPTQTSSTFSKEYAYPLVSIAKKDITITYYNENLSRNSNKKLILPNFSMGYPILDRYGTLYVSANMMHIIDYDNNIKFLKQIQNYLYTSIFFYITNTLKLKQKFFSNKVFEIMPDITKITDEENITDELLITLFKLTPEDLVGYENYKQKGEGRLSPKEIVDFKTFDIKCSPTNKYTGCLNEKDYEEFIKITGASNSVEASEKKEELIPAPVKKKIKKRLILDAEGGAKSTVTKSSTLKKHSKYKRLHTKSISKK